MDISSGLNLPHRKKMICPSNQRNQSVLKLRIPGLQNVIDIPFPDRQLPTCIACKGMFRSRDQCRLQDKHTCTPWSTSFVCIILDESCFTYSSHGGRCLVDENSMNFTARSVSAPPRPLRAKHGTLGSTKVPFCMACKEKNYTRYYCRSMKKHQAPPWITVYVVLSAVPHISKGLPLRNICPNLNAISKITNSDTSEALSCAIERNNTFSTINKTKINGCITGASKSLTSTEGSDSIQAIESSQFLMTIENELTCKLCVSAKWLRHVDVLQLSSISYTMQNLFVTFV